MPSLGLVKQNWKYSMRPWGHSWVNTIDRNYIKYISWQEKEGNSGNVFLLSDVSTNAKSIVSSIERKSITDDCF